MFCATDRAKDQIGWSSKNNVTRFRAKDGSFSLIAKPANSNNAPTCLCIDRTLYRLYCVATEA